MPFGSGGVITGENMADIYSPFGELIVVSKNHQLALDSSAGLSTLRDVITTSGSGTVTNTGTLHVLSTGSTVASEALLDTAQLGFHQGSVGFVASTAVKLSGSPTGQQVALWGYVDDTHGYGFGMDATSLFLFTRTASTDTKVYQSSFNVDKLDGTGTSTLTVSLTAGAIFQITATYMGTIEFAVLLPSSGALTAVVVHRISGTLPLVDNPVCPIRSQVINGTTASSISLSVGSRDFSRLDGGLSKNVRYPASLQTFAAGVTTETTVQSLRLKSSTPNMNVSLVGMESSMSTPVLFRLAVNTSVSSPTWGTPVAWSASETSVEVDLVGTAASTSSTVYQWIAGAGFGSHVFPSPLYFTRNQPISLMVRTWTTTIPSGTVNVRWQENW